MVKSALILKFLLLGLHRLLSMLKIESEKYAAQNGWEFDVSEEFSAFLGINMLTGICKLPSIKSY